MRKLAIFTVFALVGLLAAEAFSAPAAWQSTPRLRRTNRAIDAATKFLLSKITEDGSVEGEKSSKDRLHGGLTALTTYALLSARISPRPVELDRAIQWLAKAKPVGTYAVSLRACVMAEWNNPAAPHILRRDVAWLIKAGRKGAYDYVSKEDSSDEKYDNSNSQMAVLGLWAAHQRGVEVPKRIWQEIENHWLSEQQPDGGWNYRHRFPGGEYTDQPSYGSMTAAGLASLFVTFDALHQMDFVRTGSYQEYKPIADGLKWLAENFAADKNPRKGKDYYYYWLYSLERVGLASGYKYFGKHNWYVASLRHLLDAQSDDGSWSQGRKLVSDTAFALLFLVRGRYPVLINKLKYRGPWNARPRDAANLTRWVSWNFERPVCWQVVDIASDMSEWHDAPILYISGAGACEFSAEEIEKLRDFVLQGGMILSEAAGNSGDFTLDIQNLCRQMLLDWPLERLPENHPIYTTYFKPTAASGLLGISNGLRLLLVHSPRELSLALQIGRPGMKKAWPRHKPYFELLANLYLLATDKGIISPRGVSHWPKPQQLEPVATISITRVKYRGSYDPEPLAWRRLAILMSNRYRLKLDLSKPVEIEQLRAGLHPLAVMTGTEAFTLSEAQKQALKKYFRRGGTLVIDAAGGSRPFAQAASEQILPLPEEGIYGSIPLDHPIYQWPEPVKKASFRRDFAMALGHDRKLPRLRGVSSRGRLAIIYSPDDLTAALVGYQYHGIAGYSPRTAAALMANIICHVARVRAESIKQPTEQTGETPAE